MTQGRDNRAAVPVGAIVGDGTVTCPRLPDKEATDSRGFTIGPGKVPIHRRLRNFALPRKKPPKWLVFERLGRADSGRNSKSGVKDRPTSADGMAVRRLAQNRSRRDRFDEELLILLVVVAAIAIIWYMRQRRARLDNQGKFDGARRTAPHAVGADRESAADPVIDRSEAVPAVAPGKATRGPGLFQDAAASAAGLPYERCGSARGLDR